MVREGLPFHTDCSNGEPRIETTEDRVVCIGNGKTSCENGLGLCHGRNRFGNQLGVEAIVRMDLCQERRNLKQQEKAMLLDVAGLNRIGTLCQSRSEIHGVPLQDHAGHWQAQ